MFTNLIFKHTIFSLNKNEVFLCIPFFLFLYSVIQMYVLIWFVQSENDFLKHKI